MLNTAIGTVNTWSPKVNHSESETIIKLLCYCFQLSRVN